LPVVTKLTCSATRPAKSSREASTPESTIAIVGACGPSHSLFTPDAAVQSCFDVYAEAPRGFVASSSVIVSPDLRWSFSISRARNSIATAPTSPSLCSSRP
jgi:hypothetical protein